MAISEAQRKTVYVVARVGAVSMVSEYPAIRKISESLILGKNFVGRRADRTLGDGSAIQHMTVIARLQRYAGPALSPPNYA